MTQREVDAAHRGGIVIQKTCLAALKGQWSLAEALIPSAESGMVNLLDALRRDPDTYYVPTGDRSTTMRQLTGTVADTVGRSPDCIQSQADRLYRALRDLPPR